MLARKVNGIFNVFWNFKRKSDFLGEFVGASDFDGIRIIFVINEIVVCGLVAADVGFGV